MYYSTDGASEETAQQNPSAHQERNKTLWDLLQLSPEEFSDELDKFDYTMVNDVGKQKNLLTALVSKEVSYELFQLAKSNVKRNNGESFFQEQLPHILQQVFKTARIEFLQALLHDEDVQQREGNLKDSEHVLDTFLQELEKKEYMYECANDLLHLLPNDVFFFTLVKVAVDTRCIPSSPESSMAQMGNLIIDKLITWCKENNDWMIKLSLHMNPRSSEPFFSNWEYLFNYFHQKNPELLSSCNDIGMNFFMYCVEKGEQFLPHLTYLLEKKMSDVNTVCQVNLRARFALKHLSAKIVEKRTRNSKIEIPEGCNPIIAFRRAVTINASEKSAIQCRGDQEMYLSENKVQIKDGDITKESHILLAATKVPRTDDSPASLSATRSATEGQGEEIELEALEQKRDAALALLGDDDDELSFLGEQDVAEERLQGTTEESNRTSTAHTLVAGDDSQASSSTVRSATEGQGEERELEALEQEYAAALAEALGDDAMTFLGEQDAAEEKLQGMTEESNETSTLHTVVAGDDGQPSSSAVRSATEAPEMTNSGEKHDGVEGFPGPQHKGPNPPTRIIAEHFDKQSIVTCENKELTEKEKKEVKENEKKRFRYKKNSTEETIYYELVSKTSLKELDTSLNFDHLLTPHYQIGTNALLLAIGGGCYELTKLLLKQENIDVFYKDKRDVVKVVKANDINGVHEGQGNISPLVLLIEAFKRDPGLMNLLNLILPKLDHAYMQGPNGDAARQKAETLELPLVSARLKETISPTNNATIGKDGKLRVHGFTFEKGKKSWTCVHPECNMNIQIKRIPCQEYVGPVTLNLAHQPSKHKNKHPPTPSPPENGKDEDAGI